MARNVVEFSAVFPIHMRVGRKLKPQMHAEHSTEGPGARAVRRAANQQLALACGGPPKFAASSDGRPSGWVWHSVEFERSAHENTSTSSWRVIVRTETGIVSTGALRREVPVLMPGSCGFAAFHGLRDITGWLNHMHGHRTSFQLSPGAPPGAPHWGQLSS